MTKIQLYHCRAIWRKKYAFRERRREVEFRQRMKAKVHEAQKFDPEKFVNDYLEDMKYELVPKTYKGKRLPRFMIKVCNDMFSSILKLY